MFVLLQIAEVASYMAIASKIAVCLTVQEAEPEKLVSSAKLLGAEKHAILLRISTGMRLNLLINTVCTVGAYADGEVAASRFRNVAADVLMNRK